MASVTTESAPTQSHSGPRGDRRGGDNSFRRGRGGGGRGGGLGAGSGDGRGPHTFRRPRGRGAFRSDGLHNAPQQYVVPDASLSNNENLNRTIVVGDDTVVETATAAVKPDADDVASDPDMGICFICADPVKYTSIAPCNHVTCHICSLRMRALYKNKACAHCRTEADYVIFTKSESKRFGEFKDSEIVTQNNLLGVKFDDLSIHEDTNLLLRYNCPDANCEHACYGWRDLHHHVKNVHNKLLCDLCTRNKKVFTHEHTLFTSQELRQHERRGDDQPGSDNQSGFKGHPECEFCRMRFYSDDELYEHCRDRHERCHICDRTNPSTYQQYYIDYDALAIHFRKEHFMCADEECLERKFVVFESEIDLKAHQLEVHPNGLSKAARKDARRIDMSHFDGGRRRRRGGRQQTEPEEPPTRTEQQMSRAELAFHRTIAVQSAQSTTTRNFGGQLTDPAFAARPPPQSTVRPVQNMTTNVQPPAPGPVTTASATTNNAVFPPLAAQRTTTQPTSWASSSQRPQQRESSTSNSRPQMGSDEARKMWVLPSSPTQLRNNPSGILTGSSSRHGAVIARAQTMLRNDVKRLETFRTNISQYRTNALSAADLVDAFWALFDVKAAELGKLIHELADLFEDATKKQDLLKAWNSWKAINEDYPPFVGASSSTTPTFPSRVLKIKSSTASSSRSSTARQGAWGTAANTSTPTSFFSSLASSSSHSPTTSRADPSLPRVPAASSSATGPSRVAADLKDEFPSLPPKKFPAGWTPLPKKKGQQTAANAWAGGESSEDAEEVEEAGATGKKKKGKGKGKQLLFHVGL